jgi:LDH2 family malate/lactate/ureidoglycolate dehydrogenase
MLVSLEKLRAMVHGAVTGLGYGPGDAQIITDVLVYAQSRGNTQGLAKIATGGVPEAAQTEPLRLVSERKSGAMFSGGQSMVASLAAANKAVELAQEHGISIVAVNHAVGSSGAIGYYVRTIAKAGFIGLISVGNGMLSVVSPAGSYQNLLGTNPLAYAFPAGDGEVVFDMATAAISLYGVVEADLKGEALPEGVAYDGNGRPTTDPAAVLRGTGDVGPGAITNFAGFKGFGLSMLVQLLGSAFSQGDFPGGEPCGGGSGTVVIAIDPGLFAGFEEYSRRAAEFAAGIKQAKPLPGREVLLPGERGDRIAAAAEAAGGIDIPDGIWEEFEHYCAR